MYWSTSTTSSRSPLTLSTGCFAAVRFRMSRPCSVGVISTSTPLFRPKRSLSPLGMVICPRSNIFMSAVYEFPCSFIIPILDHRLSKYLDPKSLPSSAEPLPRDQHQGLLAGCGTRCRSRSPCAVDSGRTLHRERNIVAWGTGCARQCRRLAMRYGKTASGYLVRDVRGRPRLAVKPLRRQWPQALMFPVGHLPVRDIPDGRYRDNDAHPLVGVCASVKECHRMPRAIGAGTIPVSDAGCGDRAPDWSVPP